jgi:hypothetical protein
MRTKIYTLSRFQSIDYPSLGLRKAFKCQSLGHSACAASPIGWGICHTFGVCVMYEVRFLSATLDWLAASSAAAWLGRDPGISWRLSKRRSVANNSLFVRIGKIFCILRAAHPEVREMIHKATEDRITVLAIGDRVKDVLVPHLVDYLAWDDARIWKSEAHREELAILALKQIEMRLVITLTLLGVSKLAAHVAQVEQPVELAHRLVDS